MLGEGEIDEEKEEKTEKRQKQCSEGGLEKVLCEWEKRCQDQQHQTYLKNFSIQDEFLNLQLLKIQVKGQ